MYKHLADVVLVLHVFFVAFILAGLLLTVVGGYRHWDWVRNAWFRSSHLAAITVVVAQSWIGVICPLTTTEMWLRGRAAETQYDGSFIEYWLQRFLYYDVPSWVFVAAYTMFGILIVATWIKFPPQFKSGKVR